MSDTKHLRPKIIKALYGDRTVYLLDNGSVLHVMLLPAESAADLEHQFGSCVAYFSPYRVPSWREPISENALTMVELESRYSARKVCMLGKDCEKHKGRIHRSFDAVRQLEAQTKRKEKR